MNAARPATATVPALRTGLHGGPTPKSIRTIDLRSSFAVEIDLSGLFGSATRG